MNALHVKKLSEGKYECEINLDLLFSTRKERESFESKWPEFIASDKWNEKVFVKNKNIIKYPHKSWIPEQDSDKMKMLIVGGNPAPHSTYEDVYYAYEITGAEHRFWKVLRELEIIDLPYDLPNMRHNFFTQNYESPFILGMEAAISFPSSASAPKWSGVQGVIRLFGIKAFNALYLEEKERVKSFAQQFFQNDSGVIVAMQKHAFEALSGDVYSVNEAVTANLVSKFNQNVTVYGTPPTRWMYTKKMKAVLGTIKEMAL